MKNKKILEIIKMLYGSNAYKLIVYVVENSSLSRGVYLQKAGVIY